jgi:Na+/melibiose symporter-like transporter
MILVFLSMFGVMFLITQYFQLILGYSPLSSALRFLPIAPIMMFVSPLTPRIIARLGHNRTVAAGMCLVSIGFLSFTRLAVDTSYAYVLVCVVFLVSGISLTMSPMTAAIMSAVPPRRAGAGSAMNDATRELGAALGVAILGSIAASRYSAGLASTVGSLSGADQAAARTSLAGALQTAGHLPPDGAARLVAAAEHAFLSGIHVAVVAGAVLAGGAAVVVLRYLPRHIAQHGADVGPLAAAETAAELGLAGLPPLVGDGTAAAG